MLFILIFIGILFTAGIIFIVFEKPKKTSSQGCSKSCANKGCAEKNECGDSCKDQVCSQNQSCYKGNCCTPSCTGETCGATSDDGCGGECSCPQGQICYQGFCCTPPDCSGGKCSDTPVCGIQCTCNNSYCKTGACCNQGKCVYEDVCNSPNGPLLKQQWGKFCNSCKNCSFTDATFYKDSSIPISGTIVCQSCTKKDGTDGKTTSIKINMDSCFYDQTNGVLYESPQKCGNCSAYVCWNDADCERVGCNSCNNGTCS